MTVKKRAVYALVVVAAIGGAASFVLVRPRPTSLSMTPRAGDDTVVINKRHPTLLSAVVLDQYGRRLPADTALRYERIAGDTIPVAANGAVTCATRGDAVVRASVGALAHEFTLRCRPVSWIEAPSWLDLVVGDSARNLVFGARGPDGRAVTELRGTMSVSDGSVVSMEGTSVRPKRVGATTVELAVGDAMTYVPVVVYQSVKSFVASAPRRGDAMAMHVSLARGDTMIVDVPKAAFWVTYFSRDGKSLPPTIELKGDGSCTTGNGINARRIVEGEYAKYCLTGNDARMMIAHGAVGAASVNGTVAIRLQW